MDYLTIIHKIISSKSVSFNSCEMVTFVNPFSYIKLRNHKQVKQFSHIYLDGFILVWIFRMFGYHLRRYSMDMTSLFPKVIKYSVDNNLGIYFIGSSNSQIEKFVNIMGSEFPSVQIVGFRNGYFFNESERSNFLSNLANKAPDIVICGMGTPLQEEFLVDLKNNGWEGLGFTCGGFIHQTSKGLTYYPPFFNKLGLRWFYRMIDEPKLFYRYFIIYPKAILLFLVDLVKFKYFK